MTTTIAPEVSDQLLREAVAQGISVEAYVERLIREDEDWSECTERSVEETDPEFPDIRAAVSEGLRQAERGERRAAAEVFADLRRKHGLRVELAPLEQDHRKCRPRVPKSRGGLGDRRRAGLCPTAPRTTPHSP
jgi:hypothetical protein